MKKVEKLHFGQYGFQSFGTEVHLFSSTNYSGRKIAITAGVHGDEHSGLFCMAKIMRRLELLDREDGIQGTVCLIPSANPAALLENRRVSNFDYKDLNRVGRGNTEGSYTERTGGILFGYLKDFDYVINLHEFEMKTPVTGVFMNAGSTEVKRKTLEGISVFDPELIWLIDASNDQDKTYLHTLDTALADAGVPNFPIEMTHLSSLSTEDLEKTINGIFNVFASLGIIHSSQCLQPSNYASCAFTRHEVTANTSGLWKPAIHLSLFKEIEEGEEIGILTTFPDFVDTPIRANFSGTLIQYRMPQMVGTGTSLFSLGKPARQLIVETAVVENYEVESKKQLVQL